MIRHIVFFRLTAEGDEKARVAERVKAEIEGLMGVVPTLREIEVGADLNGSDAAWDIALYSTFDSLEDLDAYQQHPAHVAVAEYVRSVASARAVVDYEV